MNASNRLKLHCNYCLGIRWHSVIFMTAKEHYEECEEGFDYFERCTYNLAECNGCEFLSMHTSWTSSSHTDAIEEQWPSKISRKQPKWMFELFWSENIDNPLKQEFISEIYSSLKIGNLRLTVLGVRALIEQIMLENIRDQGTFKKNIEAFQSAGFLSVVQREALAPVIEAGHASMHRGFKATKQEVDAILDVTENIIESIYIAKQKAENLKIPPRIT